MAHTYSKGYTIKIARNVIQLYSKCKHATNLGTFSPTLQRNFGHMNFYNETHILCLAHHLNMKSLIQNILNKTVRRERKMNA
jgi:hypothetical protein